MRKSDCSIVLQNWKLGCVCWRISRTTQSVVSRIIELITLMLEVDGAFAGVCAAVTFPFTDIMERMSTVAEPAGRTKATLGNAREEAGHLAL